MLTSLMCFFLMSAAAQTSNPDPNAPYLKDKKIPNFTLSTTTGKNINNKQLPKYKYTCIIIFSPDCSHCEHEAAELTKNASYFKNVLFIWTSYRDMDAIKKFAERYTLDKQSNVIIGRDAEFAIPTFFRPRMTPFVAVYDNNHLLKVYEQGANITELIELIGSK